MTRKAQSKTKLKSAKANSDSDCSQDLGGSSEEVRPATRKSTVTKLKPACHF